MAHELGTYRKPGKPDRTARTRAQAVEYIWDGFKHVKTEDAPATEAKEESKLLRKDGSDPTDLASAPSDAEKAAAAKADVEKAKPKPQAPQA
jgi:hypothetical protein